MNVFDIIGPIMVGPSSSHTAGAVRIGRFCNLLANNVKTFEITFYGSFAKTYKGHCTDKALIGGILGYNPSNPKIKYSQQNALNLGYNIKIKTSDKQDYHPNSAKITWTNNNFKYVVYGSSIGGGNIEIFNVCNFEVNIIDISKILITSQPLTNFSKNLVIKINDLYIYTKNEQLLTYLEDSKIEFSTLEDHE